jgi:hypothetical protein
MALEPWVPYIPPRKVCVLGTGAVLERARELESPWEGPSRRESNTLLVSTSLSAESTSWIAVLYSVKKKKKEEVMLIQCEWEVWEGSGFGT